MGLSENVEEYLEILYLFEEQEKPVAKINEISEGLNIAPPSAVEMLKKMEGMELVNYVARKGVSLTKKGRTKARQIIRNHRLAERLLTDILNTEVDEEAICGLEHHISKKIANAVCTTLNHPRKCPHGNPVPKGKCCP
jgi:DtxR family transcriptional regulator, Mn-dependent transcriptional regulator